MVFDLLKTKCDNKTINNVITKIIQLIVSLVLLYIAICIIQKIPYKEIFILSEKTKSIIEFTLIIVLFAFCFFLFLCILILNSIIFSIFMPWRFNKFSIHIGGSCKAIIWALKLFLTINLLPIMLFIFFKYNEININFNSYLITINSLFLLGTILFSFLDEKWDTYLNYDMSCGQLLKVFEEQKSEK